MEKKNKENKQKNNPFPSMEEEVLNFWDKAKIFEKTVQKDAPQDDYVFYDGPPFATGTPHYGHIVASVMKDAVPRYWTMRGFRVERRWGWDCHGLPIENIVEKEMGSKSKKDIEEMGVEKFNEMCHSKVLGYVDEWKRIIRKLGRWADMENSYKTMDLDFMESVWWVFKKLWDKGLIYKGHRSMHICPRCETTLSQSEVAEGYKDIKDISCIAKFEFVDEPKTYILAWTTTPWTLIGNVALAVGEDINYIKVKIANTSVTDKTVEKPIDIMKDVATFKFENLIVAKDLAEQVLAGKDYKTVEELKGKDLVGLKYKPLFDYYNDENLKNRENGWKIYGADFVTTEDGTGVVHIAPAFGEDDMNLGKKYDLPFIQHVGMDGVIKGKAKDFAGMNVKPKDGHMKTDIEIIKYLAGKNLLFAKEKYEHSYPHCWRCDTPLLNYATSSWFVNITKIKDQMLKTAKEISWSPAYIKEGRFGNWLEGARDWSISRQRFWASVMPIWKCDKCGELKVFGSVFELEKVSGEKITNLHKHVVDKITFSCDKCGGEMARIPDVLDTWFDSGSMPYAQMHYPFENKEKFENNFPAEFIAEGVDQTRCWFYYLHAIANGIKEKHAYKNVIVNGIVLAEDGKKMSKKLQNYPDPAFIFDQYSADALRYYLLTSPVMLAENLNFSEDGVKEVLRKVEMILWNVYKFYAMYADELKVESCKVKSNNVLDQWIIARLNQLVAEVTENMDNYNLPKATRPIINFIDDLSTWYLRRSRDRFKGDGESDKQAALQTTGYILIQLSKIMAPFMPFISEQIWQRVTGNNFEDKDKSVHLEEWPVAGDDSPVLIVEMEQVRKIVELGLAKRDEANIKVRQPLQSLLVKAQKGNQFIKVNYKYSNLIKDEVNVKEIKFKETLEGSGLDFEIELNTELTPELRQEGIKRELVRFVNALRKNAGFTIQDRVIIYWQSEDEEVKKAINNYKEDIMKDTLADEMREGKSEDVDLNKDVKVNGTEVWLGIKKL